MTPNAVQLEELDGILVFRSGIGRAMLSFGWKRQSAYYAACSMQSNRTPPSMHLDRYFEIFLQKIFAVH
ncbi:MAG TPA: hypothetical protein VJ698_02470 [Noviherbaspirillum sp.]|uniref:hypothetical protein n=1 Tax=Noviherbaspirillum sp. TaxID=1926288 RepID=UPI002B493D4E|nr:hypothetical protein [Noviherbaspirillum sp.]HJV84313.1 hypothetical protein [Noviherbaspirillum sp.]